MKWCPLVYEYLPDFCYTCGLIGHIDRSCEVQVQKGATQQFSGALRFIPEKKRYGEDSRGKSADQRPMLPWRSSRGRGAGGSGSWGSSEKKGSDSENWCKQEKVDGGKVQLSGGEQEVNSPLKDTKSTTPVGAQERL